MTRAFLAGPRHVGRQWGAVKARGSRNRCREGDVAEVCRGRNEGSIVVKPQKKTKSWFDQALDDPMSTYATPAQVLRDERLDEAGMRAVLEVWEQDARRLMESSDEGMPEGESPHLRDVNAALAELDRRAGLRST
jgi:hypothetical protein